MIVKIKNSPFLKNSLILFIGTMGANVLGYLFHVIIGRTVSIETYGEAQSLNSLVNIIMIPGVTVAMIAANFSAHSRSENDPQETFRIFCYLNRKIFNYGLPVFLVALTLTPWIADFLRIEQKIPLILVWGIMLMSLFSSVVSGILNGWQKFREISWNNILGGVAKLIFGFFLVKLGFTLSGIMASIFFGAFVSYGLSVLAIRFIFKKRSIEEKGHKSIINFAPLRQYVIPVFIGNLAMNILGNADMVLAKHNLSPEMAGQYGALVIVSKIIFFCLSVIPSVLFSLSAERHHQKRDTLSLFGGAASLMALASVLAVVFFFIFPGMIMGIVFGSKYEVVSGYLGYFAVIAVLYSFVNLIFLYLSSIHERRAPYVFLVIAILASLVLLWGGQNLKSILLTIGFFQAITILIGLGFILMRRRKGPISISEGSQLNLHLAEENR